MQDNFATCKIVLQQILINAIATKTMTVKVLDNGSAGILVLIIPFAFGFVVLYQLWPFLLAFAALIVALKIWQNYQWQKWCGEINPYFNQLIKENKHNVNHLSAN